MRFIITEVMSGGELAEVEANSLKDALEREFERMGYRIKEVEPEDIK